MPTFKHALVEYPLFVVSVVACVGLHQGSRRCSIALNIQAQAGVIGRVEDKSIAIRDRLPRLRGCSIAGIELHQRPARRA